MNGYHPSWALTSGSLGLQSPIQMREFPFQADAPFLCALPICNPSPLSFIVPDVYLSHASRPLNTPPPGFGPQVTSLLNHHGSSSPSVVYTPSFPSLTRHLSAGLPCSLPPPPSIPSKHNHLPPPLSPTPPALLSPSSHPAYAQLRQRRSSVSPAVSSLPPLPTRTSVPASVPTITIDSFDLPSTTFIDDMLLQNKGGWSCSPAITVLN